MKKEFWELVSKMKKLLIVHNFYKDFGGEDANIYEEIEFFKKKFEVSFFSVTDWGPGLKEQIKTTTKPYHMKHGNNKLKLLIGSFHFPDFSSQW